MEGTFISHFQVESELGRGGMGIVYRARDVRLERTVALKVLRPERAPREADKVRFMLEARSASALDHPNIGVVFEVDETRAGELFIAMGYYGGGSLKERVAEGPLPLNTALEYAAQVASGLDAAHKEAIVHRDIKPANIMLGGDGRTRIVDFGLAKIIEGDATGTDGTVGTIAYMSPEQARGDAVGPRSDLYSLGAMLYELLTGTRPFKADHQAAVLYQIMSVEPEPVSSVNPELPEGVSRIVAQAMAKDPENRFASGAEMAEALRIAALWPDDRMVTAIKTEAPAPRSDSASWRRSFRDSDHAVDRTNLMILRQKVHQFWVQGVLEQSVRGEARLRLGMEHDLEAVAHPWERVLELPGRSGKVLRDSTAIGEVFDDVGRSLLILGAPGAGKTITLLELADDLIRAAEADEDLPIPVVFNLSSWRRRRTGFVDWLARELAGRYRIPRKMALPWLEGHRILPLLDGLDEVSDHRREQCLESINHYLRSVGVPGLALCCRLEEYTRMRIRAQLGGAVRLLPLRPESVDAHLARQGASSDAIRTLLLSDTGLSAMATNPLMLNVMTVALQDRGSFRPAPGNSARQAIFDAYIQRMMSRRGYEFDEAERAALLSGLARVATLMDRDGRTLIDRERIPASWLPSGAWRLGYYLLRSASWLLWMGAVGFLVLDERTTARVGQTLVRPLFTGSGVIPRGLDEILEAGVRLQFLRRAGSGYMFIHRMLLEHFADRPDPANS